MIRKKSVWLTMMMLGMTPACESKSPIANQYSLNICSVAQYVSVGFYRQLNIHSDILSLNINTIFYLYSILLLHTNCFVMTMISI